MPDYVEILGIKINKVDMDEAVENIDGFITSRNKAMVVTPNSEMIVLAQEDREMAGIINRAELSVPDGAGVVLASKLLHDPLSERVTGFDLMKGTLNLAARKAYSIYLLGGEPGVVELSTKKIREEYSGIKISGLHHGYLNDKLREGVIREINDLQPDILYVGMGVPLQEKFLNRFLPMLDIGVAMAVGGSFDVLAERVKRAPLWIQSLNLEWLYRLIQEPSRFARMTALPKFVYLVLLNYIKGKVRCL